LVSAARLTLQERFEIQSYKAGQNLHNEEHQEGEYQRRLEIFEFSCVECQWNREEKGCKVESELTDGDFPRSGLKTKIEHNLRRDAVDGAVEKPSFDSEGEDG
jgi:hypothetical protein